MKSNLNSLQNISKTSNTSNLLSIGSCDFRIEKGHENNLIFCRKSDLHYKTGNFLSREY